MIERAICHVPQVVGSLTEYLGEESEFWRAFPSEYHALEKIHFFKSIWTPDEKLMVCILRNQDVRTPVEL